MTNGLTVKTKKSKASVIVALVAILILVASLLVLDNVELSMNTDMLVTVLQKGAIYSLVCVSMNLLNGFTGLFSLGQAGFMLLGAYAYGALSIPAGVHDSVYQYFDGGLIKFSIPEAISGLIGNNAGSFFGSIICIIIAGLVAAGFAILIGIPVLRLKSDYLAIASLGFAEIIRAFAQWDVLGPITNGSNMLRKYTKFTDMKIEIGDFKLKFAILFPFIIVGLSIIVIVMLINSSYGRALKAVRDDEVAAEAMGINLAMHKRMSFVISSFFAGVSGALLAMYQTTIQASQFTTAMTYEILLIVVIGGIGSITGSCIGAFLYISASEWWLRFLDNGELFGMSVPFFRDGFRKVVFSIVIMIVVLFFRKGIMGERELSIAGIIKKIKKAFKEKALLTVCVVANVVLSVVLLILWNSNVFGKYTLGETTALIIGNDVASTVTLVICIASAILGISMIMKGITKHRIVIPAIMFASSVWCLVWFLTSAFELAAVYEVSFIGCLATEGLIYLVLSLAYIALTAVCAVAFIKAPKAKTTVGEEAQVNE